MNHFLFLSLFIILIFQLFNKVDPKGGHTSSRGSSSSRSSSSAHSTGFQTSKSGRTFGGNGGSGNGNWKGGGRMHRIGQSIKKHLPTIKKGAKIAGKLLPKLVGKFGQSNESMEENSDYGEAESSSVWSAAVNGTLFCEGKPASNVLVKLYDNNPGLNLDDLLANGYTDGAGKFAMNGTVEKENKISAKLNIYHDCRDAWPCQRKFQIFLPNEFIFEGIEANSTSFDVGPIELSMRRANETRDCFHR